MYHSVPAGLPAGRPLVTLLHGCGDTADNFASAWAEWTELSVAHRFALLFPEQQPENNVGGVSCFNWFESGNHESGEGENLSIRQMVEEMQSQFSTDANRSYVVGFSAGGAAAVNVLATEPALFAAGVAIAGVPFLCATSIFDAFTCLSGAITNTPEDWAAFVTDVDPTYSGARPRLSTWQGATDGEVAESNQAELIEQWTALHGIDATADATESILGGTRTAYAALNGRVMVEAYSFANVGHEIEVGWASKMAEFFELTGASPTDAGVPVELDAGFDDSGFGDSGATPDAADSPDATAVGDAQIRADARDGASISEPKDSGCGCRHSSSNSPLAALLALSLLIRRRSWRG